MRRTFFVIGVIVLAIWAAKTLTSKRELPSGRALARDGSAVEVTAVPGAPITIVHFWGSWCGPCRHELPSFVAFKRQYEGKGVGFVTVADDPDFATVDRFLESAEIALDPVLLDARGSVARTWDVHAYPTTFVLGPGNEILAKYRGMIDWQSPLERREILRLGAITP